MTALMAATTANAQRIGLTFGLNSSKIANENAENLVGFNGGIKADASLADTKLGNVFVEGELLFSRLGYHYENNFLGLKKVEFDEKYSYLQLPISVGHNFKIIDNLTIGPKFGVYFGFGLKGESENNIYNGKEINLFKDLEDYNIGNVNLVENYKRFDFGIGLGLNINVFEHYQLGLGYNWGCVEFNGNQKDEGYKNRNFNLNVAYMF